MAVCPVKVPLMLPSIAKQRLIQEQLQQFLHASLHHIPGQASVLRHGEWGAISRDGRLPSVRCLSP